jgi:hypothetical protein
MSNRLFAVMWDCHGLEALARIPEPADTTFALLQSKKAPEMPNIMHWQLRARANSQRHYEIYTFSVEPGIDINDIREMFKADPQMAADTIRQIGHQIYSDRVEEHKISIR